MRAHFLVDLEVFDEYDLTGDSLHHLVNVVRIEVGERLLLLNGRGLMVETEVMKVSKRELRLKKTHHSHRQPSYDFNIALGVPKREALELSLKEATEIGFRTIYLIKADRSQIKVPDKDRLEKILVSALEQSNSAWLPEIKCVDWQELPWGEIDTAILMDSQSFASQSLRSKSAGKLLLVVGPEGGFSDEELRFLHSQSALQVLNLPTPILRTPTALAVGAGMMIQSLLNCESP